MARVNPFHASCPGQAELLRLSHDALRRAGATPGRELSVAALVAQLGLVGAVLEESQRLLAAVGRELRRRERTGAVTSVDGLFAAETGTAVATHDLWSARARADLASAREAVDSAHVAVSGLAER